MDLSILIVNWNAARYLMPCLASVYREVKGIEFEVIVIDNASYDGSAELLRTEFPQATFIQSDKNLGFVRGNNLLFRHAQVRNDWLHLPESIFKKVRYRLLGGANKLRGEELTA